MKKTFYTDINEEKLMDLLEQEALLCTVPNHRVCRGAESEGTVYCFNSCYAVTVEIKRVKKEANRES